MSENANIAVAGKKTYIAEIIKAVAAALIFSLLLVLLSAFIIKFFNVPSGAVPVINQIIRTLSIFTGCMIFLRSPGCGWLRGIITGISYSLLAFVLFSLLGGGFSWNTTLLNNTAIGAATGLVSGIISMLVRRN